VRVSFQWNAGALSRLASLPQTARALLGITALAATFAAALAVAQTTPTPTGIAATAHNLSKDGKGNVKAATETQVCVFCHTPHNASTTVAGPLWNRNSSPGSYTRYTSASMDADSIAGGFAADPGGSSLLCLSCHDGMVALGSVLNVKGKAATISMTDKNGAALTYMPDGAGQLSGDTRNLQKDLSNDHPISVTYDDDLAVADGEMTRLTTVDPKQRDKTNLNLIGIRTSTYKPLLPLEPTGANGAGQVQCATCHDPHKESQKFLRTNRFQVEEAANRNFDQSKDQICLACHPKLVSSWAESAHAKKVVADENYYSAAATRRGFPGTPEVWEVGCLNCHDTHTAQGSRRLLREGINVAPTGNAADSFRKLSAAVAATALDTVSSIENTCYQCHSGLATKIIDSTTGTGAVPNIEYEFNSRTYRMPIKTEEQSGGTTTENHNIRNANFVECRKNLGQTTELEPADTNHLTAAQKTNCDNSTGSKDNRHVECTDCHNPHRARRGAKFYDTSTSTSPRTHTVGGVEGNVISGALRGTWGVEPSYNVSGNWPADPKPYTVKYGDPGTSNLTGRDQTYVTREYQLCFKCHSGYSNTPGSFPELGNTGGGTPKTTNSTAMTRYTNVAAEFAGVSATDPPSALGKDQGELNGAGIEPSSTGTANHRSWHPVMWPTGRTRAERGSASWNNLRKPYLLSEVGTLTMHCSDCHSSNDAWTQAPDLQTTSTGGPNGNVQGPHGSNNQFILTGTWSDSVTPGNATAGSICGRCHDPAGATSGFAGSSEASHNWSAKRSRYCMACHIAVPHGWKNKAFLVNLRCVQSEASGYTATCAQAKGADGNAISGTTTFTNEPYYYKARLEIATWAKSGTWSESSCRGSGWSTGGDWMSSACGF